MGGVNTDDLYADNSSYGTSTFANDQVSQTLGAGSPPAGGQSSTAREGFNLFENPNTGMFAKAGAGIAQGLNSMGQVGEVVNPNLMKQGPGWEQVDRDAILSKLDRNAEQTRYAMENGAQDWQSIVRANRLTQDAKNAATGESMLAVDNEENRRRGVSQADDRQREMYNLQATTQAQEATSMNAAAADNMNRAGLNQIFNVGAGVGQDIINKDLATRTGDAAGNLATYQALMANLQAGSGGTTTNTSATGGELGEDELVKSMKERGLSDKVINKILNR